MDSGGATDRAKRIIGSQISRALLASAIEIKKKAASDIEGKVKLCLQRDERTAHNAIDIIIQTLEQEFLGIRNDPGAASIEKLVDLTSSHVIGGMLGLVGVVRGAPAMSDRILNSLYFVHKQSNDITCLYYSSECIFNVILCSKQNEMNLDFKLLFEVLCKLCSVTSNLDDDNNSNGQNSSVLSHAMIWIDRSVREIAIKQSIDVRELVLDREDCWNRLDSAWLDIVSKNNKDYGIMKLKKLLTLYHQFSLRENCSVRKYCSDLGHILAEELENSNNYGDSACEEILGFWSELADNLLESKTQIIESILRGMQLLENTYCSMTNYTCFVLVCASKNTSANYSTHVCKKFPIEHWFELFEKNVHITLSEDAWCSIIADFKNCENPPQKFIQSLTKFLISENHSDTLFKLIEESKWLKDERLFWAALAKQIDYRTVQKCLDVLVRLEKKWTLLEKIEHFVENVDGIPADALEFYVYHWITLRQPDIWQKARSFAATEDPIFPSLKSSLPSLLRDYYHTSSGEFLLIDVKNAKDLVEWLEAAVYLLEWPESAPHRISLTTQSNFYQNVVAALPMTSTMYEIARDRASVGPLSPVVSRISFGFRMRNSSDAFDCGRNIRLETLKKLRNYKSNERAETISATIPIIRVESNDLVKEQATPKSQSTAQKPQIPKETAVLLTTDIIQTSPTSDVDVSNSKEPDLSLQQQAPNNQSGNRIIAFDDAEHIY